MIGEGEPLDEKTKLEQAKEAVQSVTDTVKVTTKTFADAIDAGRQPGAPLDRLAVWARSDPIRALAAAFVFGILVGRRL